MYNSNFTTRRYVVILVFGRYLLEILKEKKINFIISLN